MRAVAPRLYLTHRKPMTRVSVAAKGVGGLGAAKLQVMGLELKTHDAFLDAFVSNRDAKEKLRRHLTRFALRRHAHT